MILPGTLRLTRPLLVPHWLYSTCVHPGHQQLKRAVRRTASISMSQCLHTQQRTPCKGREKLRRELRVNKAPNNAVIEAQMMWRPCRNRKAGSRCPNLGKPSVTPTRNSRQQADRKAGHNPEEPQAAVQQPDSSRKFIQELNDPGNRQSRSTSARSRKPAVARKAAVCGAGQTAAAANQSRLVPIQALIRARGKPPSHTPTSASSSRSVVIQRVFSARTLACSAAKSTVGGAGSSRDNAPLQNINFSRRTARNSTDTSL